MKNKFFGIAKHRLERVSQRETDFSFIYFEFRFNNMTNLKNSAVKSILKENSEFYLIFKLSYTDTAD